jgi:hypothetical protein
MWRRPGRQSEGSFKKNEIKLLSLILSDGKKSTRRGSEEVPTETEEKSTANEQRSEMSRIAIRTCGDEDEGSL